MKGFMLLYLVSLTQALKDHTIKKRVLPIQKACRPDSGICRKGDWIAEDIASCYYDGGWLSRWTCKAQTHSRLFETADVETEDRCKPDSGKQIRCGEQGTNTRCVCSDKYLLSLSFNECKCQYWPQEDIGTHAPAFCTAYYSGGTTGIHQWTCCNNCQDPTPNTCDAQTWQGGTFTPTSYCNTCGQNTGGGRVKYYFNCGGCETQEYCSDYCSSGLGIIDKVTPGLCWKWLECFKGCCLISSTQPRAKRDAELSFCGDGVCSETESPADCPADCCYLVNNVNCTSGLNNCSHECCNEPHCCLDKDNSSNNDDHGSGSKTGVRVGIPVALILVLIISTTVIILAKVKCHYSRKKRKQKEQNAYDKL